MKTDVVIVGGGPAGTASSMFLAREGIKSVIIEQEKFPRYHIGESLTGGGGQVVRELGLEAEMYNANTPVSRELRSMARVKRVVGSSPSPDVTRIGSSFPGTRGRCDGATLTK